MTIADQINRLNNAKANIKQAIENKGVEVDDNALLDEYPALISSIEVGSGGGGDPFYEDLYNLRTSNGTNMAGMFARTSGELDLRRLDVSNVTSMKYMFDNSSASVNIEGWDTSNVTDIYYMFYNFTGSIDASKLDTSKVTNASYMFGQTNTDKIILTGLSFPSTKSLDYMFYYASGTTLDLSSWDISNITNMSSMFSSAKYTRIDLTGWKTTNVTNMSSMFNTYSNPLVELIIPDWDMTNVSTNIFNNSSYIPNLKLIDLSRSNDATIIKIASYLPTRTATTFGTVLVPENTSQEAYDALVAKYWAPIGAAMSPVPTSIEIITELDEIMPGNSTEVYFGTYEPWYADDSKVELVLVSDDSMATMTEDNEVISTGVVGNIELVARIIDTQEVIGTKTITVSETDSYPNLVKFRVASTPSSSYSVITVNGSSKRLSALTYDSYSGIYSYDAGVPITSIKFSTYSEINELIKLNTSNITAMDNMFASCFDLRELDLSDWDTSKVTNMGSMFMHCNGLRIVDMSNFNMENVTSCVNMFRNCHALHTLRLDNCSNATISKIINSGEFPAAAIEGATRTIYCKESEATGLTAPTNWVFSYVTEEEPEVPVDPPVEDIPLYVPGEFEGNMEITEVRTMVDESHDDLSYMFFGCSNLVSVNTEDWDTSNVGNMTMMFYECTSLTQLDLSNFNTVFVWSMSSMFQGCTSLTTLDLSNWETASIATPNLDMDAMFSGCTALHTLRLDNCSNDTISKIIKSIGFPANAISGVTRTIYCKEENAAGLTAPTNWVFSYVD